MNVIQAINKKEKERKKLLDNIIKDIKRHIEETFPDMDTRSFSAAHAKAYSMDTFFTLMLKDNIMSTMTTGKSHYHIPLYQRYFMNHLLDDTFEPLQYQSTPKAKKVKIDDNLERIMSQYTYDSSYVKYLPTLKMYECNQRT